MTYFLLLTAVLGSGMQSVFAKLYGKYYGSKNSSALFNLIKSIFILAFSAVMLGKIPNLHIPTMLLGTSFGIFLAISMSYGYKALVLGPLSLTSLLVSYSLIIPTGAGIFFFGERPSLLFYFGLLLLFISIVFINFPAKQKDENSKVNLKWLICVLITFITNGLCSTTQKLHQFLYPGKFTGEFVLWYAIVTVICFAVFFANTKQKSNNAKIQPKQLIFGAGSGISNGIMNYLTLVLSGKMDASILFPAMSALTMILACIFSRVIFKSKLKANQIIGVFIGIISLVLLKS